MGLHHDEVLGIFQNKSKLKIQRKKKETKVFEGCNLLITIQCNYKQPTFYMSHFT